jgi:hypothetical protein
MHEDQYGLADEVDTPHVVREPIAALVIALLLLVIPLILLCVLLRK